MTIHTRTSKRHLAKVYTQRQERLKIGIMRALGGPRRVRMWGRGK